MKPILNVKKIPIRHTIYNGEPLIKSKLNDNDDINNNNDSTNNNNDSNNNTNDSSWIKASHIDRTILKDRTKVIASFDVGIKHLAYCVMAKMTDNKPKKEELAKAIKREKAVKRAKAVKAAKAAKDKSMTSSMVEGVAKVEIKIEDKEPVNVERDIDEYKIFDWGILNLVDDVDEYCSQTIGKSDKICGKRASFYTDTDGRKLFCGIHSKKVENIKEIKEETDKKNGLTIDIQTLCINMVKRLDSLPIFLEVDEVLIEQQPAFGSQGSSFGKGASVHPRMKNLSYMIYSYFIMKGVMTHSINSVKFISSNNKLKIYDGPEIVCPISVDKSNYTRNKYLAKEHLKYFLQKAKQNGLLNFFDEFKKKDDLADCFLQGAWYLSN